MTKNKTFKTKTQAVLYFICKDMLAELDEQEHLVPLEKEERLSKRIEHLLDKGFFINISESSDDKHLQTLNKYLTDYCEQNFKQKFEGVQYSWEESLPAKKVTRKTISPLIRFTFNNLAAVLDSCETCQPLIRREIKNRRKPESTSKSWLLSDYSHSANNCKIIIAIFFLYLDKSITLSSLKQYQNKGKTNWDVIQDLMATFLPKKASPTTPFTFDNLAITLEACDTCQPFLQDELKAHKIPIRTVIAASEQWLLLDFTLSENNRNVFISLFLHLFNKSITVSDLQQVTRNDMSTKIKSKTNWAVIQSLIAKFSLT